MNAVETDATAEHHDVITRFRFLFIHPPAGGTDLQFAGDKPDCASVHERLAAIARVHRDESERSRNAALIAACIDAVNDAFKNAPRRQKRLCLRRVPEKLGGMVGVRDAKAEGVGDGFRAESESEAIAIPSHNGRHRTAEGVQSRRRVMRFHFVRDEILVVERDCAGVVFEYRNAKVFFSLRFPYLHRRTLDVAAINSLFHLVERVCEYRVLAMLRPCLRQSLQLDVRRIALLLLEVITYHLQLFQRERERPPAHTVRICDSFLSDFCELRITHVEIYFVRRYVLMQYNSGNDNLEV